MLATGLLNKAKEGSGRRDKRTRDEIRGKTLLHFLVIYVHCGTRRRVGGGAAWK